MGNGNGDGDGNGDGNCYCEDNHRFLGERHRATQIAAWRALFPPAVAVSVISVDLRDSVLKERDRY